jgi:hypothetical protein
VREIPDTNDSKRLRPLAREGEPSSRCSEHSSDDFAIGAKKRGDRTRQWCTAHGVTDNADDFLPVRLTRTQASREHQSYHQSSEAQLIDATGA